MYYISEIKKYVTDKGFIFKEIIKILKKYKGYFLSAQDIQKELVDETGFPIYTLPQIYGRLHCALRVDSVINGKPMFFKYRTSCGERVIKDSKDGKYYYSYLDITKENIIEEKYD